MSSLQATRRESSEISYPDFGGGEFGYFHADNGDSFVVEGERGNIVDRLSIR